MQRTRKLTIIAAALFVSTNIFAQAAVRPIVGGVPPTQPVPGLIFRVLAGHEREAPPTNVIFVAEDGKDWVGKYMAMAATELRGKSQESTFFFLATGYIIVDTDMDVLFDVLDGEVKVSGKGYGDGKYRHPFKKGKYPIEIKRKFGHGQPSFNIKGPKGETVLFHTGEMLNRELNRSIKVEKKTVQDQMS